MILEPVKFLLVDDSEPNLFALEELLRREDLQLLKARSGAEALELLLVHEVALAILDVQMPELDGFELAELMRGTERTRRIPIMFLTAGVRDERRRFRGYEAGAVDFLFKPIQAEVLKGKAEVFFELYRQRQEVARQRDELQAALQQNATLLNESRYSASELASSRQKLRLALDAAGMGTWVYNIADGVWDFDSHAQHLYGVHDIGAKVDCETIVSLIHPHDRERMKSELALACSRTADGSYSSQYRVRHNRDWRWLNACGHVECDASGSDRRPLRIIGASRDVTDTKLAELALYEADQRKDEFIATLAHELRNPLAPIRNALQLLELKGPREPEIDQLRELIDRQVLQLARLVDDLLEISRITRGKLELRREHVLLPAIIEHALEVTRPVIEAAGHTLSVHAPPDGPWLYADSTRIAQVLTNLLNNAAKYTPPGGKIWLDATLHDQHVVLTIRDTGIGIPKEHLDRIFEMFSQVTPALERSQGGLGIGLALVKGLVELHGGSVQAYSEGDSRGSRFSVHLPIANPRTLVSPSSSKKGAISKGHRSLRVLVVDDNRDVAETFAMLLKALGHEAAIAYDGLQALNAAEHIRPQVVLLDIGLPTLSGYEVAERIRQQPWGKSIVLIAQTGWGQSEDKRRARESGFDHHLTKPVDPTALARLLS